MKRFSFRSFLKTWGITVFFVGILGVGLVLVDDYGLSWDEPRSRLNGFVTADYLLRGDPTLFTYEDRQYGPVFEVVLFGIEKLAGLTDSRSIYLVRHGLTFLLFWAGAVAFYHLAQIFLASRLWGWVATGFLLLSPRIFADGFYNSKDIPVMVLFIVSYLTFVYYRKKPQVKRLLLHALSCALLVDIRIVGIVAPALTMGLFFVDGLWQKKRLTWLHLGIFGIVFTGLTVLFWPWLWSNPVDHFRQAFEVMRVFPWERMVRYWGSDYLARNLPWHYLPVWIGITTPLLYLGSFLIGLPVVAVKALRKSQKERVTLWLLGWLLIPLAVVLILRPVLYDGWRQVYFLYPALILVAVSGLQWLGRKVNPHWLVIGLIVMGVLEPLGFMIKNHPHEYVFFNLLAKPLAAGHQFELDYWGLSYRQGLEYILATDSRDKIRVFVLDEPGRTNAYLLPQSERNRLVFAETPNTADYGMTTYRWQTDGALEGMKVYSLVVDTAEIMAVYQLHP